MKVKITDLMALYEDEHCSLSPTEGQNERAADPGARMENTREVNEVKQSKHRFGWKEALSLAAALALVVLGGFGVKRLIERTSGPSLPGASDVTQQTESSLPQAEGWQPLEGEAQKTVSSFLSFFAMQQIQNYPEELSDDGSLIHLAFLWRRNYDPESFTVREGLPELALPHEGLTPEQVNETLSRLLGKTVTPPEDGAEVDYSPQIWEPDSRTTVFSAGWFWDDPGKKDASFFFALATEGKPGAEAGQENVRFRVYYINYERWGEIDLNAMHALTTAEAETLEAEDKLILTAAGEAKLERIEDGYRLLSYQTEPAAEQNNGPMPDLSEISWQLTYLAEQGIEKLETDLAEEYELAQFVHIYLKRHSDPGSAQLSYQSDETGSYETVGLGWVNLILDNMFGKTLSPIEGTDYTVLRGENYAQHESFHDGFFWWPAADGETSTRFARCNWARQENGQVEASFMVYEADPAYMEQQRSQDITLDPGVDLEDWIWNQLIRMDDAELQTHIAAGEIIPIRTGTAKLQKHEQQGWRLLSYEAEPLPPSTEPDPDLMPDHLMAELKGLFETPTSWYSRALSSSYADPADADLYLFFYDGLLDGESASGEELKELFEAEDFEDGQFMGPSTDRLPRTEMDKVLKQIFGLDLEESSKRGLDHFIYLKDTDCYYHCHGDTNMTDRLINAVRCLEDGTVLFTYADSFWNGLTDGNYPALHTAALRPDGAGNYLVVSNLPGEWVTAKDLGALGALYRLSGPQRAETRDADGSVTVRELNFGMDGEFHYREGDPDSEFSCWAWGKWWLADDHSLCCTLCETKEDGNRIGPWYTASFGCSFEGGELILTQLSETGFHDDAPGTELRFAPVTE